MIELPTLGRAPALRDHDAALARELGASYLLTRQSTKTVKGEKFGVLTGVMYLAPARESGVMNTCPWSTAECRDLCLRSSGRMRFGPAIEARRARTEYFAHNRRAFIGRLYDEIYALAESAGRRGMEAMVRLNGTSDLPWESIAPDLFQVFNRIQFYDYTKSRARMARFLESDRWPLNYHLTFSRSEENEQESIDVLTAGGTVAVVFDRPPFPRTWQGFPTVDGDKSDIRPRDPAGVVVALKAKGAARKRTSSFVVPTSH